MGTAYGSERQRAALLGRRASQEGARRTAGVPMALASRAPTSPSPIYLLLQFFRDALVSFLPGALLR